MPRRSLEPGEALEPEPRPLSEHRMQARERGSAIGIALDRSRENESIDHGTVHDPRLLSQPEPVGLCVLVRGRLYCGEMQIAIVVLLVSAHGRIAVAQDDCPADLFRGPKEVTPNDSAQGVTLDAPVIVRYSSNYFDDSLNPVSLSVLDGNSFAVEGTTEVLGDVLIFHALRPWTASTAYRVQADGRDGNREFRFTSGTSARDQGPPVLGEIEEVTSSEVGSQCDLPEGGYRVDVAFRPATDDGPPGSIEYALYLTRGSDVDGPTLKARMRNFATDQVTIPFVLGQEEAIAPVCVTVHATDGLGQLDADGAPACFDPIEGNFFEPLCSASTSRTGRAHASLLTLIAMSLVVSTARRAQACRRRARSTVGAVGI